jgi:hypothetical protein
VPYYYANDNYYVWNPTVNAYESVSPPPGPASRVTAPPATSAAVFAYPKNGQTSAQQANDRFECHRAAVAQSGFDPTTSVVATPASTQVSAPGAASPSQRQEYLKAQSACLEGRGYSVK